MKNTNNIIGVIGFVLFAAGIFFKFMHYPGASVLVLLGSFAGTLFFLLSLTYKEDTEGSPCATVAEYLLSLSMIASMLAFLFMTQHWPGAHVMLIVALVLMGLLALVLALAVVVNKDKKFISLSKVVIALIYIIPILIFMSKAWE